MNKAKNRSYEGVLLTVQQACCLSNLGATTVRRLAAESGAARKIGAAFRIDRKKFFDYIDGIYRE